ncbi:MAG: Stp1/IreP family PP2C-type Ser/Thr phosphatase [bacterium]
MDLTGILEVAGRTDTGCVRTHNEDSIGEEIELGTVVLADGMGGYHGGEVASGIAVNTILNYLHEHLPDTAPGIADKETGLHSESILARDAIAHANTTILSTASNQQQYKGMGTTVVLGIFHNDKLTVAHVGDSRMYRYRNGDLEHMTVDHTLLQELIDRGFYTEEEARQSLNKNLVTRALGIEDPVQVDVHETQTEPGDIYLLCSDGLNDMILDEDILLALKTFSHKLQDAADNLVKLAKENGGKDNISVILARPIKPYPAKIQPWYSILLSKLRVS